MHQLSWSRASLDDLRNIDAYLTLEAHPDVAIRVLTAIRERADSLRDFPLIGPMVIDRDFRSLVVRDTSYVILYRSRDSAIEIVRIYHQKQNWRAGWEE